MPQTEKSDCEWSQNRRKNADSAILTAGCDLGAKVFRPEEVAQPVRMVNSIELNHAKATFLPIPPAPLLSALPVKETAKLVPTCS